MGKLKWLFLGRKPKATVQARVGDRIQMRGDSVPEDLADKWFLVERIDPVTNGLHLSRPFVDEACRLPYIRT